MSKLTQSYAHGVSTTPLIGETIGVHFDKAAEKWGARDAIIVRQQNVRLTYNELKAKVDAFAAGLLALGLAPGDRIGIWSPNNSEWAITQFATAKAGLILVTSIPLTGCRSLNTPSTRSAAKRSSPPIHSSPAAMSACCASSRRRSTAPRPADCRRSGCRR
jgi:fatty-acyl-CoA synthase